MFHVKHWHRLAIAWVVAVSPPAWAAPLPTIAAYCAANKDQCARGTTSLLAAKGSSNNTMYMLEVDPATGAIPVDATVTFGYDTNYGTPTSDTLRTAAMLGVGSTAVSNANPVPISDAGGTITVDGTVTANQGTNPWTVDGAVNVTQDSSPWTVDGTVEATQSGAWSVGQSGVWSVGVTNLPATADTNYGTPGASTLRGAAMLGVGNAAVSNGNPVPISDAGGSVTVDGTVATSNLPATADTNFGTPGSSTIRTAAMLGVGSTAVSATNPVPVTEKGAAFATSAYISYASTGVTTGAWVQIVASTAAAVAALHVFSGCGEVLELGTGGSGSEVRQLLIPPGGPAERIMLTIPASTRLSLRGVSGNCSAGYFTLSGYG